MQCATFTKFTGLLLLVLAFFACKMQANITSPAITYHDDFYSYNTITTTNGTAYTAKTVHIDAYWAIVTTDSSALNDYNAANGYTDYTVRSYFLNGAPHHYTIQGMLHGNSINAIYYGVTWHGFPYDAEYNLLYLYSNS